MPIPNYRVVLSFDAERKVFSARAPELEHCAAEGATRGEAISKLESEIEAQVHNMQERGHRPPNSVDEHTYGGEITAKVSRTLHRDLVWQARQEGIELDQLLSELLAAGLDGRRQGSRGPRGNRAQHGEAHENAGNQRDHREPRQGYGSRYNGLMEDRANFIEYVRGLEGGNGSGNDARGQGPRPGAPRGPRPDGGGGGRGPRGDDNRGGGGPRPDNGDGRRRRGGRGHGPQRFGPGGPGGPNGDRRPDAASAGPVATGAAPVSASPAGDAPTGQTGGNGDGQNT